MKGNVTTVRPGLTRIHGCGRRYRLVDNRLEICVPPQLLKMSTDNTGDTTVNGSNNNDHVAYIVANLQVLIPRWLEKYGYDYPIVVLDTSNWDWDNFVSF